VLVALTCADGDDRGLDRLLLRRVRDEQTTSGLGLLIETLDQNSIVQRTDLHFLTPKIEFATARINTGRRVGNPHERVLTECGNTHRLQDIGCARYPCPIGRESTIRRSLR